MNMYSHLFASARESLLRLIQTPSVSREEDNTARIIQEFFDAYSIPTERIENNVIARSQFWSEDKPVILLNSHHDTVKPSAGWVHDPFVPKIEGKKITGLGSNDAGAPLVSLMLTFVHYYAMETPFNLLFVASAEEEVSGKNGMELVMSQIDSPAVAIVGEPTGMNMAVAEKGLLVLDCTAHGVAGHAAHNQGENAIYKALPDIDWCKSFEFPKQSELLGPVKMTVTGIQAGTQHNVIPDTCTFMVDVRTNELYSNQEVFEIVQSHLQSEVVARSFRLNSSHIPHNHPLVVRGKELGFELFGSPTLSDQAFITNCPSVKIGPGDTHRSHAADEYILESEIRAGITGYIKLLDNLQL